MTSAEAFHLRSTHATSAISWVERLIGYGTLGHGTVAGVVQQMRRVIAQEWMAFDGVVQAPGAPDEDPTGGFAHGGWHLSYFDDLSMN
jgi:hypothetical protein